MVHRNRRSHVPLGIGSALGSGFSTTCSIGTLGHHDRDKRTRPVPARRRNLRRAVVARMPVETKKRGIVERGLCGPICASCHLSSVVEPLRRSGASAPYIRMSKHFVPLFLHSIGCATEVPVAEAPHPTDSV